MASIKILCDCPKTDFTNAAKGVLSVLNQRSKYTVELVFAEEDEIRQVNKEQRGVDEVTDVLSFPTLDGVRGKSIKMSDFPYDYDIENGGIFLGSIMICLQRAKAQAEEFGHSQEREYNYLFVHGLLHLFGYDHMEDEDKKQMRALEEKVMDKLKLTR